MIREDLSMRLPAIDEDDLASTRAQLRGEFDIRSARFTGDQSGIRGEGSISRSVAERIVVAESVLSRVEMTDAIILDSDCSNSVIAALTARRVEFRNCRMTGWRASFVVAEEVAFLRCRLDYAQLDFQRTKGTVLFDECVFREASLRGMLDGCIFQGCDLSGLTFGASSAAGCDLTTSKLVGSYGLTTLRGARISNDQMIPAAEIVLTEIGIDVVF
jgi:uncharacterized protein YjbI with pentapeptide repeats